MTVPISYRAQATGRETLPTTTAGHSPIVVNHQWGAVGQDVFYRVWSSHLPVTFAAPVVLDLSALNYPSAANDVNLVENGQRLSLVCVRNEGADAVNFQFNDGVGGTLIPRSDDVVQVGGDYYKRLPVDSANDLYALPPLEMTLRGVAADSQVSILLATFVPSP